MTDKNLVFDANGQYTRVLSVERDALENSLKKIYGSQWCEIASSGLNAIYVALFTIFNNSKGKIFLLADEVFGGTYPTVVLLCEVFSKTLIRFDQENSQNILDLVNLHKEDICCIFLESCSNPSNKSTDWKILDHMKQHNILVVVDNTWLSPIKFNPFDHNVDIVVDSCTKYLSGGKCIAGCINFKEYNDISKKCARMICLQGIHVSPIHCEIITEALKTLDYRVLSATNRSIEIYYKLYKMDIASDVCYNTKYDPCVIRFGIANNKESITECKQILSELCKKYDIDYSTSFGKDRDSIDTYPKLYKNGIWLRLAVGYNECDDFIERLTLLLNDLTQELTLEK